jgi:flavin-dependent dehydrogenase
MEPGTKSKGVAMYDVIVVGARCAGSPVAMLLARKGHRVLVVDRAHFPSDTMSTHFIQIPGVARLHRWGLLQDVIATGAPPIAKGQMSLGGQSAEADFPAPGPLPGLVAPRRTVLDKLLVDAAAEAGAEIREGAMVDELIFENDRVAGVRGHTATESSFEERARMVIGADGRNSFVARGVGASSLEYNEPLSGGYYSYWSNLDTNGAELYIYDDQFTVAFPTNDGLTTIAMIRTEDWYKESRRDPEGSVQESLDRLGSLGDRARSGKREHDLIPATKLPNFIKQPAGPGWALVGDAVYHKDPTPADGIADAYRGVDLLASAVDDFLSERTSEPEAMTRYQEEIIAASRPLLQKTYEMTSFDASIMDRGTAFLEIQGMHAEEAEKVLGSIDKEEVMA